MTIPSLVFQTGPPSGKDKVKKGGSYMCHKVKMANYICSYYCSVLYFLNLDIINAVPCRFILFVHFCLFFFFFMSQIIKISSVCCDHLHILERLIQFQHLPQAWLLTGLQSEDLDLCRDTVQTCFAAIISSLLLTKGENPAWSFFLVCKV